MHTIENFVDSIHQAHLDNARQVYVAKTLGRRQSQRDVSPLTNFVFEFFLYNSLYAVDWERSYAEGQLVHHDREIINEAKMQNTLETFCRQKCREGNSSILTEALLPLAGLNDLTGQWTQITTDDRIKAEDGVRFFAKIAELGQLAAGSELGPTRSTFELIASCRYFAYGVRNNIFHGSKSLGETYEENQARRIGVYDLFLRCLTSLFFLATGKREHGAALSPLPILQRCGTAQIEISLPKVYQLLTNEMLKPEDSILHWKLFRTEQAMPVLSATDRRGLFYPSAGKDFFFPLLVGLPFCTDFFFYEKVRQSDGLSRLRRATKELVPRSLCREVDAPNGECLEFEFDSVTRRAWIVHEDNTAFLTKDIPLAFYFHRGDSPGEGGSDQRWDSDLLPQLLAKADREIGCRILTDGEPGGLLEEIASKCQKVSLPNSHRERDYFFGVIR
ncbi:hypothetical protein LBMAG52_42350 [Planctomycetia bacterium]|nr:hypothetical protein LBMAG52_42350 [Planctomycetia bacterium]